MVRFLHSHYVEHRRVLDAVQLPLLDHLRYIFVSATAGPVTRNGGRTGYAMTERLPRGRGRIHRPQNPQHLRPSRKRKTGCPSRLRRLIPDRFLHLLMEIRWRRAAEVPKARFPVVMTEHRSAVHPMVTATDCRSCGVLERLYQGQQVLLGTRLHIVSILCGSNVAESQNDMRRNQQYYATQYEWKTKDERLSKRYNSCPTVICAWGQM